MNTVSGLVLKRGKVTEFEGGVDLSDGGRIKTIEWEGEKIIIEDSWVWWFASRENEENVVRL